MPKIRPHLSPLDFNAIKNNPPPTEIDLLKASLAQHQKTLAWYQAENKLKINDKNQRYSDIPPPKTQQLLRQTAPIYPLTILI